MSNYHDRGIIKWSPFDALSGRDAVLEKLLYELYKIQKTTLSEDEIEDLNKTIKIALDEDKEIAVEYYYDGYTYQTFGKIKKMDNINKTITLDTLETFNVDDILDMKIVR